MKTRSSDKTSRRVPARRGAAAATVLVAIVLAAAAPTTADPGVESVATFGGPGFEAGNSTAVDGAGSTVTTALDFVVACETILP